MSLRARLGLAFVSVVLVPLATVAVLLGRAVPSELRERAAQQLGSSLNAVAAEARVVCQDLQLAALEAGGSLRADPAGSVVARLRQRRVPVALLLPAPGATSLFGVLPGLDAAATTAALRDAPDCSAGLGTARITARQSTPAGTVVTALPLAPDLLDRLRVAASSPGRADPAVTVVVPGAGVTASTLPAPAAAAVGAAVLARPQAETESNGQVVRSLDLDGPGPGTALLAVSLAPRGFQILLPFMAAAVVLAGLVAAVLGLYLAQLITGPLVRLGAAARRIAAGDLDTEVPVEVGPRDEVGSLAAALAGMTGELRSTIRALQGSRDELRRDLSRLGDTLSGTHDLVRIVEVVVDAAVASLRAGGGALLLSEGPGKDLVLRAGTGLRERIGDRPLTTLRLPPGAGVLGRVQAQGWPVRGRVAPGSSPDSAGGMLVPDPAEPAAGELLAVPLRASERIMGVLVVYDRQDGAPFDEADLSTLTTLAGQAAVAVDNVLLHQEAQRLAITDGLTGLWNYRYLSLALPREVERAVRFGRPLAVLMLDLDRFKEVNDQHGHQRGDAVLVEVAARVTGVVRDVDVLARYGGEELVLLLPETDRAGAEQLADRIGEVVRGTPFGSGEQEPVAVTVSTGVAVYPAQGATAAALLRAADEALYEAKRAGRDTWRVGPPAAGSGREPEGAPPAPR